MTVSFYGRPGEKLPHLHLVEPKVFNDWRYRLYSAWMFESEIGWCAVHDLEFDRAVQFCKDYKRDWGEDTPVALVPAGCNPQPYFRLAALAMYVVRYTEGR